MIKKLISIIIASAAAATVSLTAFAETAEPKTEEKLNYIYTEIKENYISDYKLYEQVMYGQIVFYTNISNGDITSDGVVIELPTNVETVFERDGKKLKFTNNAEITKLGSYSLTVIAKGSEILGGEKNDRYYGLFRFRIMEPREPDPVTPEIDVKEWETEEVYTTIPVEEQPEPTVEAKPETAEAADPQTAQAPPAADDTEKEDTSAPAATTATGAATTAAAGTGSAGTTADNSAAEPPAEAPLGDTSLIRAAPTDKNIRLQTAAGSEIFTNIPPNMKTSGKVNFTFAADVQYKLYRDGIEITGYNPSNPISDKGKYQLFVYDGSGELPAELDFEITGDYLAGVTSYSVPQGCRVSKALFEGNMIRSNITSVDLGSEGTYTVEIAFGNYIFTETFILDNTPPEFGFDRVADGKAEGGTVTLLFQSEDVERYEFFFNGKPIEAKKLTVSEPGKYTVRVYDRAGNMSEQSFELLYQMDFMAVVVVIILVGIVVAGIAFFVISRRKFIVR